MNVFTCSCDMAKTLVMLPEVFVDFLQVLQAFGTGSGTVG